MLWLRRVLRPVVCTLVRMLAVYDVHGVSFSCHLELPVLRAIEIEMSLFQVYILLGLKTRNLVLFKTTCKSLKSRDCYS